MNICSMMYSTHFLQDGYGIRMKGIHLVTPSKMVEALVVILRQVFTEKLGGRIQVHKDLESVYKEVPKHVLPKDYGGEESPLEELHSK